MKTFEQHSENEDALEIYCLAKAIFPDLTKAFSFMKGFIFFYPKKIFDCSIYAFRLSMNTREFMIMDA